MDIFRDYQEIFSYGEITPHTDLFINAFELPGPLGVVEKLAQVKAVVVCGVALSVIGWGESGHLVSIDGVTTEEMLHFLSNLERTK